MAQLIQLRQRIKAIETIKKITQAMRLISMSMHTRLRTKGPFLEEYNHALIQLCSQLHAACPNWENPYKSSPTSQIPLIILIGSQKGLCGNFNNILYHFFQLHIAQKKTVAVIPIGKRALEYTQRNPMCTIIKYYTDLGSKNNVLISRAIMQTILAHASNYHSISIISNTFKTFFIQKPHLTQLIPLQPLNFENAEIMPLDYIWEQSTEELLDYITRQTLEATIYNALYQSLLAEQAARFLSMDNATRNAKKLLDITKLHYNKLRQAKITKELTELTSSFQSI